MILLLEVLMNSNILFHIIYGITFFLNSVGLCTSVYNDINNTSGII